MQWQESDLSEIDMDEHEAYYKEWDIRLSIPNGGILGVSVVSPRGECWWCYTEKSEEYVGSDDTYSDDTWHVEIAQQFIDSRIGG